MFRPISIIIYNLFEVFKPIFLPVKTKNSLTSSEAVEWRMRLLHISTQKVDVVADYFFPVGKELQDGCVNGGFRVN